MRIRLVVKRFSPAHVFGGAEVFVWRIADGLIRLGARVDVLSARYRKEWKRSEHLLLPTSGGAGSAGGGGVFVRRLPHPRVRFFGTLVYNTSLFLSLLRERSAYDAVFVAFASGDAVTSALAGVITGKPVLCKVAASGPDGDIGQVKRRWHAPLTLRLLRRVDRFVALNPQVRDDLVSVGVASERIVPIPNGVDTAYFSPTSATECEKAKQAIGLTPETVLVLGVGRLGVQKSWETLIRALGRIESRLPGCHLVLLGEGQLRPALLDLAHRLRLQDKVTITVEPGDVRRYLRAADVFVLPSLWEGLSNALLEAMATALACVCTDIPGNADVIKNNKNGLLFPTGDDERLGELLLFLLTRPGERLRLGTAARQTAERNFGLESVVRSYLDTMLSLGKAPQKHRSRHEDIPGPALAGPGVLSPQPCPPEDADSKEDVLCT